MISRQPAEPARPRWHRVAGSRFLEAPGDIRGQTVPTDFRMERPVVPLIRLPELLPMTTVVPLPERVPVSASMLIVTAVMAAALRPAVLQ